MNKVTIPGPVFRFIYRLALWARRLLGKRRCRAFDQVQNEAVSDSIERIYVINLDRQLLRWKQVTRELSQVLDASGSSLRRYATRVSAVDALEFENSVNTVKLLNRLIHWVINCMLTLAECYLEGLIWTRRSK